MIETRARKTKNAMETLGQEYSQVTLDLIASHAGFRPNKIQDAAYDLAPKLGLLIGKEAIEKPPPTLIVGVPKNPDRVKKTEVLARDVG